MIREPLKGGGTIKEDVKKEFTQRLLQWSEKNLRQFDWRRTRTPYSVFVAELLLRRTTSTAAHRVYCDFLHKFPDIRSLASADIEEVEETLRPIGLFHQRARAAVEAAQFIVREYQGVFPSDYEKLKAVPHIGDYTAGCILDFGMDMPTAIVDSNVQRVMGRVFASELGEKPDLRRVLEFSRDLVPGADHVCYNYGLIDFGALVCTYRPCKSLDCPMLDICDAAAQNRPVKAPVNQ